MPSYVSSGYETNRYGTSRPCSITVSGENKCLFAWTGYEDTTDRITSIVFDAGGLALDFTRVPGTTRNKNADRDFYGELFYLLNPPDGAYVTTFNWSGSVLAGMMCLLLYEDVSQDDPFGTPAEAEDTQPDEIVKSTITVSAEETQLVVDFEAERDGSNDNVPTEIGQTARLIQTWWPGTGPRYKICSSDKAGAASVTTGWKAPNASYSASRVLTSVPVNPPSAGRSRLVKYWANTYDPKQRIRDNQGKTVKEGLLSAGEWFRNEGAFLMKANKKSNLIEEPSVGFIESVNEQKDKQDLQTSQETMLERLFQRLGGSSA